MATGGSGSNQLRVVGVDWAVDPKNRGLVELAFDLKTRTAHVESVLGRVPDEEVVRVVRAGRHSTVAVDVPFGWPAPFADFTPAWSCVDCRPDLVVPESTVFQLRRTDLLVRENTGLKPLSVSSDRIALAALSWVRLVATNRLHEFIDVHPERPARPRPSLVEVYPAATLAVVFGRGTFRGYKDDLAARGRMLDRIRGAFSVEWSPEQLGQLEGKGSHAADALVAAVTALMYEGVLDRTVRRPTIPIEVADARREGWIFTPMLERPAGQESAAKPNARSARTRAKG